MSTKSMPDLHAHPVLKGALLGAEIGGALGLAMLFLYRIDFFGIPGAWVVLGIIGGAVIGAVLGAFQYRNEHRESVHHTNNDRKTSAKLQLKKEELEITKRKVETARVETHFETIIKDKTITVPVTREELVIEKTVLDNKKQDEDTKETIRIPISEERVDVTKHPVELEDVLIYRDKIEDVKHIDETLKVEKLHIETKGHAEVKNVRSQNNKKHK